MSVKGNDIIENRIYFLPSTDSIHMSLLKLI